MQKRNSVNLRRRRSRELDALSQRCVSWLVPVLIALVTSTAFLPTLHNQFVNWDDSKNFLDNPHYRGLGWTHLRWMWTTHLGHYIPLTWMTLGLDYLVSRGVQGSRITVISYGEERPVCRERTEACWAKNRRAHFLVKAE